ncbi:hypothetical protein RJG79_11065 [Mycoplasmatota bacterium WC44]
MSRPVINKPDSPVDKQQAIVDVIESIALEEVGLAHILNAEGEKIQKGIAISSTIEELIKVNMSVNDTLKNVSKVQMLLQFKLEEVLKHEPKKHHHH